MKKILAVGFSSEAQVNLNSNLGSFFDFQFVDGCVQARAQLATKLGKEAFSVVVLEVDLPDGSGFELCSALSKRFSQGRQIPVVFLTEKAGLAYKIMGFEVGADDYVVQPFEPMELRLRLEARIRASQEVIEDSELVIRRGNLTLTVPYQTVTVLEDGVQRDLKFTPTEFKLLYYLVKNEGLVLERDQFFQNVWGGDEPLLPRTIDKHISTLKRKIGTSSTVIQSVHGRGYRFAQV